MRRSGFTLVEVLVVGVIVAILAALTASVFLRVRRSAWDSTCKANLSQLGKAMQLYLAENDDYFPPYGSPATDGNGYASKEGELKETLMKHGVSDAQFYCPLDSKKRTDFVLEPGVTAFSSHVHTSYLFLLTPSMLFVRPADFPFSANRVKEPAKHMLVMDQHDLIEVAPDDSVYRSAHGDRVNVCYLDGHVKSLKLIDPDPN